MKSARSRKSSVTSNADTVWNLDLLQDSLVSRFSEPEQPELNVPSTTETPNRDPIEGEQFDVKSTSPSSRLCFTDDLSYLKKNEADTPRATSVAESKKSSASSRTGSSRSRKGKRSKRRQVKRRTTEIEHTYVELPNSKAVQCGGSGRIDESDLGPFRRSTSNANDKAGAAAVACKASSRASPSQVTAAAEHISDIEGNDESRERRSETPRRSRSRRSPGAKKEKRIRRHSRKESSSSLSPSVPRRIACNCRQDYVHPRRIDVKDQETITEITGDTSRKGWVGFTESKLSGAV